MAVTLVSLIAFLGTTQAASAQTQTFSNSSPTTFIDEGSANPYPTTIQVSGMSGPIQDVNVTLSDFTSSSGELDVLLVSPGGDSVMLTSDFAFSTEAVTYTYDDAAVNNTQGNPG